MVDQMTAKKRAAGLLVAGLSTALLLAGCSGGATSSTPTDAASGEPQTGGTVHMLQNADFSFLDPARGWDGGVNAFYRLLYRGLTMQAAGDADDPNAIDCERLGAPSRRRSLMPVRSVMPAPPD